MAGRPKGVAKSGGRQKGTRNKATADIKALAQKHGAAAIERLAWLMKNAGSEQAQVAALKEILDRGFGKAAQPLTGDGKDGAIIVRILDV